jgi:hypothetical protein
MRKTTMSKFEYKFDIYNFNFYNLFYKSKINFKEMATKGNSRGRYMTKVGHYDIYGKDSYRPKKDGSSKHEKPEVSSTDFQIYHAKKLIEKGFKTQEIAIERAKKLTEKK